MNIKKLVITTFALTFFFIINSNAQETKDINNVLAKKVAYNKENPTGIGYKIQLYNVIEAYEEVAVKKKLKK